MPLIAPVKKNYLEKKLTILTEKSKDIQRDLSAIKDEKKLNDMKKDREEIEEEITQLKKFHAMLTDSDKKNENIIKQLPKKD
jgi:predicted  nucleic acid-binding Zn-ribbon protein